MGVFICSVWLGGVKNCFCQALFIGVGCGVFFVVLSLVVGFGYSFFVSVERNHGWWSTLLGTGCAPK